MKTDQQSAKETVLAFIKALNSQDFNLAKTYLSDDMKFEGVLGSRDGADAYIKDMEHMKFKYDIQKVFTDEHDVCLFYEITMAAGLKVLSSGWYHISHGKIKNFRVIFDPRPVLESQPKK